MIILQIFSQIWSHKWEVVMLIFAFHYYYYYYYYYLFFLLKNK